MLRKSVSITHTQEQGLWWWWWGTPNLPWHLLQCRRRTWYWYWNFHLSNRWHLSFPVPYCHSWQQEGFVVNKKEWRRDCLHLWSEPQGQSQELHGWPDYHYRLCQGRWSCCICLHWNMVGRFPNEPLHSLGWFITETKYGGGCNWLHK